MREIKFRGFSKEDEKWVYGFYVFDEFKDANGRAGIAVVDTPFGFELTTVHPKSIGQYTGLKDKNGTEICEGDIVCYPDAISLGDSGEWECIMSIGVVEYGKDTMSFYFTNRISVEMNDIDIQSEVEVIGNIYENPKLIDR